MASGQGPNTMHGRESAPGGLSGHPWSVPGPPTVSRFASSPMPVLFAPVRWPRSGTLV